MADRQPFAAPGTTRIGDGDTDALLPEARRQLFLDKLLASTAGVPIFRRQRVMENGDVINSMVAGPIERVQVTAYRAPEVQAPVAAAPLPGDISRIVWLPEGFVITPKVAAIAPDGFGMPPTPDGLGTPGGQLRQVIINRFAGNQYPDVIYSLRGGVDSASRRVWCAAPLFFMEWEMGGAFGIGVRTGENGTIFSPQFSSRWVTNYAEPEGSTWLCHRPMNTLAGEKPVHLKIRSETNALRVGGGDAQLPLNPPLRGFEGQLSEDVLYNIRYSTISAHDNPLFRPGYMRFEDRIELRYAIFGKRVITDNPTPTVGENIVAMVRLDSSTEAYAVEAVNAWRLSPEHYANMTYTWEKGESGGDRYPMLDCATNPYTDVLLTGHQLPPYSIDSTVEPWDPAERRSGAAQIFYGMTNWVVPSAVGQEGDGVERMGVDTQLVEQGHGYYSNTMNNLAFDAPTYVHFKGRSIAVHANDDGWSYTVTTAKMFTRAGVKMVRTIGPLRTAGSSNDFVVLYEGKVENFLGTRVELARHAVTLDLAQYSIPKFSASGERVVFSYTVPATGDPADDLPLPNFGGFTDPIEIGEAANYCASELIRFVEFSTASAGAGFVQIKESSLMVDMTARKGDAVTPGPAGQIYPYNFGKSISQKCVGEYELLADYDGETVVYAKAVVACYSFQDRAGLVPPGGAVVRLTGEERGENPDTTAGCDQFRGLIRCPDGTEIVYLHTDTKLDFEVSGYFCHFLYLDIMQPARTAVVRYDISGTTTHACRMRIIAHGQTAIDVPNILPSTPYAAIMYTRRRYGFMRPVSGGEPPGGGTDLDISRVSTFNPASLLYQDVTVSGGALDPHWATNPTPFNYPTRSDLPVTWPGSAVLTYTARFHATLVMDFRRPDTPGTGTLVNGEGAIVGPLFLIGGWNTPARPGNPNVLPPPWHFSCSATFYKGEWIYAGYYRTPLTAATNGLGQPNAAYWYASSLDLKTLTGLPLLEPNILPIGIV